MHSKKGNMTRKLLHTAIVICVTAICFASIGIVFAKYTSAGNAKDQANVALFSPSLLSEGNIDISGIKMPGDSVENTFRVQNSSGGNVSEVTMKYQIVLKTTGNLPLTFTLLDGEGNSVAVWNCNGISGKQEYKYEGDSLIFSPGVDDTHNYKLKVDWQTSQNGAQFAGRTDAVYLSVIWEQVD